MSNPKVVLKKAEVEVSVKSEIEILRQELAAAKAATAEAEKRAETAALAAAAASKGGKFDRRDAAVRAIANLGINASKEALIKESGRLSTENGSVENFGEAKTVLGEVLRGIAALLRAGYTLTFPEILDLPDLSGLPVKRFPEKRR